MTDTNAKPGVSGWLPAVLVAFSAFLFVWTIREGRAHGQDHMLPHALERHSSSLAVAISDMRYGLNRGYGTYRSVLLALETAGMTSNADRLKVYGVPSPDNQLVGWRQDYAITCSLNVENVEKDGVINNAIFAEDVGYVDFAKLAFRVFGYKFSALFSTYFLIMGVSLAAYVLYYRRDAAMLTVLLFFQFGFFLIVRTLPEMNYPGVPDQYLQLGTVINGRFLSTLGLIPLLHLGRCLVSWPQATPIGLFAAGVQAAVLAFSLHLRGSAAWMFLTLFALAAAPALAWTWRSRSSLLRQPFSVSSLAGLAKSRWPAVLIVAAFLGQKAYISSAVHWTYKTDSGLPHHLVWHSAYVGLTLHPEWEHNPAYTGGFSDDMAFIAARKRLEADGIDKSFLMDPMTGGYKARLHDMLMQKAYLDVVRKNPGFMLELMAWHKPKSIRRYAADTAGFAAPGFLRPDSLCILAGLVLAFALAASRQEAGWRPAIGTVACGVLGSVVPFIWAYPQPHVMSEFCILLGMLSLGGGLCLVHAAVERLRRASGAVAAIRIRTGTPAIEAGR